MAGSSYTDQPMVQTLHMVVLVQVLVQVHVHQH